MSDAKRIADLRNQFSQRETEELLAILESEGQSEWTVEALEAAKQVLAARGFDLTTYYRGKVERQDQLLKAQQHLERAMTYEQENQLNEAVAECNAALEIAPNFAGARNFRGVILEQLGRKDEAIAEYELAVKLDPGFIEARDNLIELKAELNAPKQKRFVKELMTRVGWGSLSFAIALALAGLIRGLLLPVLVYFSNPFLNFLVFDGLTCIALGGGSGVLAYKYAPKEKVLAFVVAGFIGSFMAQFVVRNVWGAPSPAQILVGCVFGLALELVQWKNAKFGGLILAGGLGFSVKDWIETDFVFRLIIGLLGSDFSLYREFEQLVYAMAWITSGAVFGILLGGLMGLAMHLGRPIDEKLQLD